MENEEILALSKLSCAIIRQAARDLLLDTEILPGMTKGQMVLRKKNQALRLLAFQWASDTQATTKFPLADCCDYISEALAILRGEQSDPLSAPYFPEEKVREALLTRPQDFIAKWIILGDEDGQDEVVLNDEAA